ncbi:D-alanyl-D-alanine carboxypeptidase/D-alanyl-D-alanine endopeptidase [Inhella crocodyli]|uniref:D-alanyl-D-alanine carboxypeptidase/D-alanyl-D-alanine-endopeptidase n=1 Tax=Inhella crocodyli TaxID=2499851 RepID=A0A437LH65_9BURK|nr:D-alanyl-D-alanine carboxypeptidase/D-alanyl-D-alanine-endopeptidase [Inhella crocodyli]RVT84727.1 D-alanyl-D-alanine carboxypeptidase/D-alanyl-D-alanine-endopeptidase [Inhella crocodyli]
MKRRDTLSLALAWASASAWGQVPSAVLPDAVQQALRQAQLPASALALWCAPVQGGEPRLAWRAQAPHNPASLAKLATTWMALTQLGPGWRWRTPVWLDGRVDAARGVLKGDLVIQGRGDPSLVLERLWLLLRRVQQLGVREIDGDLVLDSSAFAPEPQSPADFDGEAWSPGNVQPDALLLNFKSHTLAIRPDAEAGVAWVRADTGLPPLLQVPLRPGPCRDPRGALRANWVESPGQPAPLHLAGSLPAACGPQQWPLADADPATYNARLLAQVWRELGGQWRGQVRSGPAPTTPPSFEWSSPALAEVVRDINKHSNNLMAEQLALTLAWEAGDRPATRAAARQRLAAWLQARLGWAEGSFVLDNGSGLSRQAQLSAAQLGQLLQAAWQSPVMPEFAASLPLAGVDGTLSRDPTRFGGAQARAHLKTGSLRDVAAVAGYVQAQDGQRWALVAMLQHPQARSGRGVLDAAVRWAAGA